MSTGDTEPEQFDNTDAEDAELLINDPDDYHHAQRLKEIHDARRGVRDALNEIERYAQPDEHETNKLNLADAVTAYIAELEPLMEAADYDDSLDRTDWDNLRHYADLMGRQPDETKTAPYEHQMFIFRQANRFLADVKPLIESDDPDEWEV